MHECMTSVTYLLEVLTVLISIKQINYLVTTD